MTKKRYLFFFMFFLLILSVFGNLEPKRIVLSYNTEKKNSYLNYYEGFICCINTYELAGNNKFVEFINSFFEWICQETIFTPIYSTLENNPSKYLYLAFPDECKSVDEYCSFKNKDIGFPVIGNSDKPAKDLLKKYCSSLERPPCAKEGEKGKAFANFWSAELRCCPNLKPDFWTGVCKS